MSFPMYKPVQQTTMDRQLQTSMMEQTYYVFQDLENVLGILAETTEVLQFFEGQPNHQMAIDAQNRLITQINLSNTIQFDQSFVKDPILKKNLKNLKSQAKDYFESIRRKIPRVDKIDHIVDHYVNDNLSDNNKIHQLPNIKTQVTTPFNQQIMQKVINGINQVDSIMDEIKAGKKVDIPSKDQFQKKMQERREIARNKLNQNFKKGYQENQTILYGSDQSRQGLPKELNQYEGNWPNNTHNSNQESWYNKGSGLNNQTSAYQGQVVNNNVNGYSGVEGKSQKNDKQKNGEMEMETERVNSNINKDSQMPKLNKNTINYLYKLNQEIKYKNNINVTKLQDIIDNLRQSETAPILINFFKNLQKELQNSEMGKLCGLIITAIDQKGQSKTKLDISKIKTGNFFDQQIQFMGSYIYQQQQNATEY